VYFLQSQVDGSIKVGSSADQPRRQREVQSGNAGELVLLGTCAGGDARETALKRELAEHKIRGEWFHPTEEVAAAVARCLAEEYASEMRERVLSRAPEVVVPGTRRERERAAVVAAVRKWLPENVDVTGCETDRVTTAQLVTSFTNWTIWAEEDTPPGSKALLRQVLGEQVVVVGARYDRSRKVYVRLLLV
jgi:hypothetical protein